MKLAKTKLRFRLNTNILLKQSKKIIYLVSFQQHQYTQKTFPSFPRTQNALSWKNLLIDINTWT